MAATQEILLQQCSDLVSSEGANFLVSPAITPECTYQLGADARESPHNHVPYQRKDNTGKILPNILEYIGNTPLVRLNSVPQLHGVKCEVLAKCEFLNPGGSIKDRIAHRMVLEAEKAGKVEAGCTLVESTAGNTGIGMALVAAAKGYDCIATIPDKFSGEKSKVMNALGAKILITPTGVPIGSPGCGWAVAQALPQKIQKCFYLNQFGSAGNALAHYDGTAEEILDQCDGKLDMMVIGAGSGGMMTGISRKLKEKLPDIEIVAADPCGSCLAPPEMNQSHITCFSVEGIGRPDFVPTVCDRKLVDRWIKTSDRDSFRMAREMMKKEGLLCGESSGALMCAAMQAAKRLKEGQRCVVILPDGITNYMSTLLDDGWMVKKGFHEMEDDEADEGNR